MNNQRVHSLVYIALFAALLTICAWITIPVTIPFTMQTLAVFLAPLVLGGKRGSLAVAVYLLLGAVGVPVFSGFHSGLGALVGNTGGYLVGFLISALLMWALERFWQRGYAALALAMAVSLLACYAFGTAWFVMISVRNGTAMTVGTALSLCVVPFIIPDAAKMFFSRNACQAPQALCTLKASGRSISLSKKHEKRLDNPHPLW